MRLRIRIRSVRNRYSINMIPFINIIFLLLIFFLLTMNLKKPEGVLDNRLPQVSGQENFDAARYWETLTLRIKKDKQDGLLKIYMQERAVNTYSDLLHYLNQLPGDITIIIEPDNDIPYKHVIGVYNICLKSKKKNIVFSMSA